MAQKYVYFFGPTGTEGDASMGNTLGGKGANLAEMAKLELPVPAGFTITTEFCTVYLQEGNRFPDSLKADAIAALKKVEAAMGMKYGDPADPLLMSCRSGARKSMPGMMETVLNVGLCSATIPGLIKKTGNERFVYDAYRRLIMMYSDVVMEKAEGIEPAEGKGIRVQLEHLMADMKKAKGVRGRHRPDGRRPEEAVRAVQGQGQGSPGQAVPGRPDGAALGRHRRGVQELERQAGRLVPQDRRHSGRVGHRLQRAEHGVRQHGRQLGHRRGLQPQPGHGREQVLRRVAGQRPGRRRGGRHPHAQPAERSRPRTSRTSTCSRWKRRCPGCTRSSYDIRTKLEQHYKDMQDIEFTIQEGKLYMLQCRNGKRTGTAALNMAMDMLDEKLIDEKTAVTRVEPAQLDELLHPIVDPAAEKKAEAFVSGLPAGPGGACGQIVFTSADAVAWAKQGKKVILVREETNPEDVEGMRAAQGILTARGGMTSHAALVARGWGKCCIVGAGGHQAEHGRQDHDGRQGDAQGRRHGHPERHPGPRLPGRAGDDGRHREPAFPGVHEDRRQVPHPGRPHQRRHAGRRHASPAASAPRASACSAPSTCSTARAPTSRCSSCGR